MIGSWGRTDFGKYSRGCSRTVVLSLSNPSLPFLYGDLLYLSPGAAPYLHCAGYDGHGLVVSRCKLEMLQWIHGLEKFMFHEPGVYLATGLDFHESIVLILGRSEPDFGVNLLPCHFTMKER